MLLVSTQLIAEEAVKRGWRVEPLDERFISTLAITPPGSRTYYFDSVQPPFTSAAAVIIADNKLATYLIAQRLGIPVADFIMHDPHNVQASHDFLRAQLEAGYELVVKPIDTNHGDGITVGVRTAAAFADALDHAHQHSSRILVQQRAVGADCRVVVVNGKVIAAARRDPAWVVGDGVHTIEQLVEQENSRPHRGVGYAARTAVTQIDLASVQRYLGERMHDIPKKDETVEVLAIANISKGGKATDITNELHPTIAQAAVKITNALDMYLCGVDFLLRDHTKPLDATNGTLLEINATPGLRMHHFPLHGTPRNVAAAILDGLSDRISSTNR